MTYFRFVADFPGSWFRNSGRGTNLLGLCGFVAVDLSWDPRFSNLPVEVNWAKFRSVTGNDFRNGLAFFKKTSEIQLSGDSGL